MGWWWSSPSTWNFSKRLRLHSSQVLDWFMKCWCLQLAWPAWPASRGSMTPTSPFVNASAFIWKSQNGIRSNFATPSKGDQIWKCLSKICELLPWKAGPKAACYRVVLRQHTDANVFGTNCCGDVKQIYEPRMAFINHLKIWCKLWPANGVTSRRDRWHGPTLRCHRDLSVINSADE